MTAEHPEGWTTDTGSGISREDVRRALQQVELRAAEESNADRAAAFREAGTIVETELIGDDTED